MTSQKTAGTSTPLDWRELSILAVICFATVLAMGLGAEVGTRLWWAEDERNACLDISDRTQFRPQARCVAHLKNAEGPWVSFDYNDCGYRSPHPCGPKKDSVPRIVVMGTSTAAGLFVPYDEHFAARTERALSAQCGRPVELQNVGSLLVGMIGQQDLLDEVAGLRPDAVVLVVNPADVGFLPMRRDTTVARPALGQFPQISAPTQVSGLARLRAALRESRALVVAQHFMLENEAFLFRVYQLGHQDDVLRNPLSSTYAEKYATLEVEMHVIGDRFRAEHVPVFLMPLPNRIQAGLISHRVELPDIDPWAFSRKMKSLADHNGLHVVDAFTVVAKSPHAERLFYPVDGHVTGDGNALIAAALQHSLLLGAVPALNACTHPR